MSQAEKLAKTARENLAAALNTLQMSPDVPAELMLVADIIAQCMGVLHRIERTQGADLSGKEIALKSVREALDHLQALELTHPALEIVLEKVAGSLASVHGLSRLQAPPPAAPVVAQPFGIPQPPPAAPPPVMAAQAAPAVAMQPFQAAQAPGMQPFQAVQPTNPGMFPASAAPVSGQLRPGNTHVMPASAPVNPPAPPNPGFATQVLPQNNLQAAPQPGFPLPTPAAPQQIHAQQYAPAPVHQQAQAQPYPQSPAQPHTQSAPQGPPVRHETVKIPTANASAPPAASASESGNVVVELGAHSVSNFYKGLGGNDVIEHGGLFVATYRIPKIGTNVKLRVLLPGDYEFMAVGVVQWIRDPHSGGDTSEPGFGARLTQITPEGRQLVYRYTRNREPMFYDDL